MFPILHHYLTFYDTYTQIIRLFVAKYIVEVQVGITTIITMNKKNNFYYCLPITENNNIKKIVDMLVFVGYILVYISILKSVTKKSVSVSHNVCT